MRRHSRAALVAMLVVAVAAVFAAAATAGLVSSLGTAKRTVAGKQMTIVVDRRGDTVYELSGESLGRLQCVTRQCLSAWPPVQTRGQSVKVPKSAGVPGKVTVLRRVKGNLYQVMLDNHPLYFYAGDTKIGDTNGQGVKGPGGTWHVVPGS